MDLAEPEPPFSLLLLRAMAAHADCAEVQEFGCGMLANMTAGDDNARTEAVIAAGGAAALAKAMLSCPDLEQLQLSACRSLYCMTLGPNSNAEAVVAAGGVEAILHAMALCDTL